MKAGQTSPIWNLSEPNKPKKRLAERESKNPPSVSRFGISDAAYVNDELWIYWVQTYAPFKNDVVPVGAGHTAKLYGQIWYSQRFQVNQSRPSNVSNHPVFLYTTGSVKTGMVLYVGLAGIRHMSDWQE